MRVLDLAAEALEEMTLPIEIGAVNDEVFHIRVIDEILMHSLPYPAFTPSGKEFVGAVLITIFGGEHPPLRTGPGNPQNSINEPSTFGFLPNVQAYLNLKESAYSRPLFRR